MSAQTTARAEHEKHIRTNTFTPATCEYCADEVRPFVRPQRPAE